MIDIRTGKLVSAEDLERAVCRLGGYGEEEILEMACVGQLLEVFPFAATAALPSSVETEECEVNDSPIPGPNIPVNPHK